MNTIKILLVLFILLFSTLAVSQTYENFVADYTEVDALGEINVGDTDNHDIILTDLGRGSVSYVRKDFTADHFGDFECQFEFNYSINDGSAVNGQFALANGATNDNMTDISANDAGIYVSTYGSGVNQFNLSMSDKITDQSDTWAAPITLSTWFYITIIRSGTTLTLDAYDDAARTNLVDGLSIICCTTKFQYFYPVITNQDGANNDRGFTGEVRNYEFIADAAEDGIPLKKKAQAKRLW